MTEKETRIINRLGGYIQKEGSKEFTVELFKLAAAFLNASSITRYAEDQNISYQGAVKRLNPADILHVNGLKIVIDNL